MYIKCYAIVSMKLINTPKCTILHHFFKGGRHLHEIFNESIIFMSHFSIGMIDIHKKNKFKIYFFLNSKWPLGSKNRKNFPAYITQKMFLQSFIILHVASLGVTLCSEPTIS